MDVYPIPDLPIVEAIELGIDPEMVIVLNCNATNSNRTIFDQRMNRFERMVNRSQHALPRRHWRKRAIGAWADKHFALQAMREAQQRMLDALEF